MLCPGVPQFQQRAQVIGSSRKTRTNSGSRTGDAIERIRAPTLTLPRKREREQAVLAARWWRTLCCCSRVARVVQHISSPSPACGGGPGWGHLVVTGIPDPKRDQAPPHFSDGCIAVHLVGHGIRDGDRGHESFPPFSLFERCAQANSLRAASFAWLR